MAGAWEPCSDNCRLRVVVALGIAAPAPHFGIDDAPVSAAVTPTQSGHVNKGDVDDGSPVSGPSDVAMNPYASGHEVIAWVTGFGAL